MIIRNLTVAFIIAALCSVTVVADELSGLIDSALTRAADNAPQLRAAIDEAADEHREGVRFLIAHMPDRDLRSLSADYLLANVRFAYLAWSRAPWKDQVPTDIFLNDILPYASINERRDDWREDFYTRFSPLVAAAESPGEAAVILNQRIFKMLDVRFSRNRPKADQSPYETIEAHTASCTGLSVLLIDACRAVGVPARLTGIPSWPDQRGNHSWVEIWDGHRWRYTGAAEPSGDQLDRGWFTGRTATAIKDQRLHAIYATSFKRTDTTFPMVWARGADDVYAVNVTDRYTQPEAAVENEAPVESEDPAHLDLEASMHALAQLTEFLKSASTDRAPIAEQGFATVALTRDHAREAEQRLIEDHARRIRQTRADEMEARKLTAGDLDMPFYYKVFGDEPEGGRSLYISMHGGGGAPARVNDQQWNNQKTLYRIDEGVYCAPRAPTNTWNLWHQGHIDGLFDRLIENLIVFEGVNPDRVYLLGYSAGGDGVFQLAPRMADRFAAAAMMAGHPNEASPLGLRNLAFTIHAGGKDGAYNRNKVALEWGQKLDDLQADDPNGYVHRTQIHEDKGHWMGGQDAAALPWMAQHTRNPLPERIVWRQDDVTHTRFYWLAVKPEHQQKGREVRATHSGQHIDVRADDLDEIIIRLSDRMMNLDEPVTIAAQDRQLYRGRATRTIATVAKTLAERGDPLSVFSSEIVVPLKSPAGQ